MEAIIVIFWLLWLLVYPIAIGLIAQAKGRSFVKYFLLSIFLTPIFTLLALIVLGRTNQKIAYDEIEIEAIKSQLQAKAESVNETATTPQSDDDKIEAVTTSQPDDNGNFGTVLALIAIIIVICLAACLLHL